MKTYAALSLAGFIVGAIFTLVSIFTLAPQFIIISGFFMLFSILFAIYNLGSND